MKFFLISAFTLYVAVITTLAVPVLYNAGDDIAIRGIPVPVPGVGEVAEQLTSAVIGIVNAISEGKALDAKKRGDFTTNLVGQLSGKDPSFNYVVCHTQHKTAFDGVQGKDWGHSHQELDVQVGGTIGFEIYKFKSGKFTRIGDGGFLNWAYQGNVASKSSDGKEITFKAP